MTAMSTTSSRACELFGTHEPIGFAGNDTNLHRYVGNHPTYATDPSGLYEKGTVYVLIGHNGAVEDEAEALKKNMKGGGKGGDDAWIIGIACGGTDGTDTEINTALSKLGYPVSWGTPEMPLSARRPIGQGEISTKQMARDTADIERGFPARQGIPKPTTKSFGDEYTRGREAIDKREGNFTPITDINAKPATTELLMERWRYLMRTTVLHAFHSAHYMLRNSKCDDSGNVRVVFRFVDGGGFMTMQQFAEDVWGANSSAVLKGTYSFGTVGYNASSSKSGNDLIFTFKPHGPIPNSPPSLFPR